MKTLNTFEWSLFLWQIFNIILLIALLFLIYKFGKVLYLYLKKNKD
ncbi:MAG: hypothetical protein RLZZ540_827 [Bacteroidota bacterium]|jgi:hypothetical protein